MINFKSALLIASMAAMGCTSAHISEPSVCDNESIDFGSIPSFPSGTLPNQSVEVALPPQSISVDFSSSISKVSSIATNLQMSINSLTIMDPGGDLNWVSMGEVWITGSATDGSTPSAQLGTVDNHLDVNVSMSGDKVLHYFQSGKVSLLFNVRGFLSPNTAASITSLSNNVNVCMSVSGDVSKSL